jgi:hypothetical protein
MHAVDNVLKLERAVYDDDLCCLLSLNLVPPQPVPRMKVGAKNSFPIPHDSTEDPKPRTVTINFANVESTLVGIVSALAVSSSVLDDPAGLLHPVLINRKTFILRRAPDNFSDRRN